MKISNTIRMYRNNTGVVNLRLLKSADRSALNIPVGNTLHFTVKKSVVDGDDQILIQKATVGDGGNEYEFILTGQDTNLLPGIYKWDLKDEMANLTLYVGDFKIMENVEIGVPVVYGDTEMPYIDIEVNVDAITVISDYEALYNKPKINSVELSGNKSLTDLDLYSQNEIDSKDATVLQDAKDYADEKTDALDTRLTQAEEDINDLDVGVDDLYSTKQDVLTAGENVSISNNVISATDTTDYTLLENTPQNLSDFNNDEDFISEAVIDSKDAETLSEAKDYTDTETALKVDTTTFETAINNVYTKAETTAAIASAIEGIVSFDCQIVETLPASGVKGTIYLTEKTTTETGDIYNEYLWIVPESGTGIWEKIGNTAVDISGKLDKPTTPTEKSVITIDTNGTSGTVAESDFVKQKQIASSTIYGIVKIWSLGGIAYDSSGVNKGRIFINKANDNEIVSKNNSYKPIVPASIDLATKVGVTTNTITLTDAEKQSACSWLGAERKDNWELINSGTTEESVEILQFAFNNEYRKINWRIEITNTNINPFTAALEAKLNTTEYKKLNTINNTYSSVPTASRFIFEFEIEYNNFIKINKNEVYRTGGTSYTLFPTITENLFTGNITGIRLRCHSETIPVCSYQIYGVRA